MERFGRELEGDETASRLPGSPVLLLVPSIVGQPSIQELFSFPHLSRHTACPASHSPAFSQKGDAFTTRDKPEQRARFSAALSIRLPPLRRIYVVS